MRPWLFALFAAFLVGGCGHAEFSTQAQKDKAYRDAVAHKSERIVPAALEGMWISDKGSVLTFGPNRTLSTQFGIDGKTTKGTYKLEGYKLVQGSEALGWISLGAPDEFIFATSREHVEHFRRFA